ncbi:CPBP family intramembrane glutamic endopeptidase [Acidicapsa acidisoli]|uniref:CPBP family intramembrane glutamic endopeptidase n=1 Tax=Acidicapsa acidisoli TaxID=1615681 RepID=UPI0021E05355|nr:CPBP family intramembrane glutamic endopeptidase [Acidicapsa acidisoli]
MLTFSIVIAALLTLAPYLAGAFFGRQLATVTEKLSVAARLVAPATLCVPYGIVGISFGVFRWYWLALYATLPVAIAVMLHQARCADAEQRGNWRDYLVLILLGMAVDLRWFEPAWPAHFAVFNKILLLDAGIYGFGMLRRLDGVGFDLRLRLRDLRLGLREFLFYTPIAIVLGLGIGFLHFHDLWPSPMQFSGAYLFTFFFIAVPEELFFRGWMQNLLERRIGRYPALILTAALFGLSHWNKRTTSFNWQYVLLAILAGVFYGRAWRQERRVGASAITHATVDTVWSIWLR